MKKYLKMACLDLGPVEDILRDPDPAVHQKFYLCK